MGYVNNIYSAVLQHFHKYSIEKCVISGLQQILYQTDI